MESLPIYLLEIVIISVLIILFAYLRDPFDFWKTRGVPYCKPSLPFLGNLETLTQPIHKLNEYLYNSFPGEKFYGTYILWRPTLVVKDPELIEQLLIKDFSFLYNRNYHMMSDTNILSDNLGNHVDEQWKSLRSKLTPSFTTGKLKGMQPQMVKCAKSLTEYLSRFEKSDFEMKDICGRYALDVIASCGFGLELDVINKPDNEFYEIGKQLFLPDTIVRLFFMLQPFLRTFYKALSVGAVSKRLTRFVVSVVDELLEFREKNNIHRPDIFHHLVELKKRDDELIRNKKLEADDPGVFGRVSVYSNSFMFLAAGYESSGTTLSHLFYQLAVNQDIQEKLHDEISNEINTNGGKLDFDSMKKMVYLDHVLSETLRMYPPGVTVDRAVTKEYRIPGTDVILPIGTMISIPIYGMHHDAQYFPDPYRFNPERFDPKKNSLTKGTYLPFGAGPRTCIATRFAKTEIKVCVATVLEQFKIFPCSKTKTPIEFDPNTFMLAAKDGVWLSLKKRLC